MITWKRAEVTPVILKTGDHVSQTTTDRFHCSQFCQKFEPEPEPERLDFTITSSANKHNLVEQTTSVHFWRLTGEHPGSITL